MRMQSVLIMMFSIMWISANAQYENAQKGDIIDIDGKKAIVYQTDEEGHGCAMYVGAFRGHSEAWCTNKKNATQVPTYSETDGMQNMKTVIEYSEANGIDLSVFPAFQWCRSLGEGWFLPSIKEMETFVNFILGNEQEYDWDSEEETEFNNGKATTEAINESIREAGGIPFIQASISGSLFTMGAYTSTKNDKNKVYVYEMDYAKNVWRFKTVSPQSLGKYTIGRAFYRF